MYEKGESESKKEFLEIKNIIKNIFKKTNRMGTF